MSRKESLRKMLEKDPRDPFLHYALGLEHAGEGDTETALAQFDRVLAIDAKYVGAYQQKSQLLIRLGRNEEARACIDKGIETATAAGEEHAADELRELLAGLG